MEDTSKFAATTYIGSREKKAYMHVRVYVFRYRGTSNSCRLDVGSSLDQT